MRKLVLPSVVAAVFLGGCGATGTSSMSVAELTECLQPNRRVVVEVGGSMPKPPPKPKPGEAAPPKPAKPAFMAVAEKGLAQGNSAFDSGSATLKTGGQQELDKFLGVLKKRSVTVRSVIISGHTDRLEIEAGKKTLAEDRAKAVRDYLVNKGVDSKLIFWEGKDAKEPVPVTKFCS